MIPGCPIPKPPLLSPSDTSFRSTERETFSPCVTLKINKYAPNLYKFENENKKSGKAERLIAQQFYKRYQQIHQIESV